MSDRDYLAELVSAIRLHVHATGPGRHDGKTPMEQCERKVCAALRRYLDSLTDEFVHLIQSNHGYKPTACDGCRAVAEKLERIGHAGLNM